jgi:hypothetical protein
MRQVEEAAFLKKSGAKKTFVMLGYGRWRCRNPWPRLIEVFCFFSSEKKCFLA